MEDKALTVSDQIKHYYYYYLYGSLTSQFVYISTVPRYSHEIAYGVMPPTVSSLHTIIIMQLSLLSIPPRSGGVVV